MELFPAIVVLTALLAVTVGIGLMATVGSTTPVPVVALYLLVAGVGLGAELVASGIFGSGSSPAHPAATTSDEQAATAATTRRTSTAGSSRDDGHEPSERRTPRAVTQATLWRTSPTWGGHIVGRHAGRATTRSLGQPDRRTS